MSQIRYFVRQAIRSGSIWLDLWMWLEAVGPGVSDWRTIVVWLLWWEQGLEATHSYVDHNYLDDLCPATVALRNLWDSFSLSTPAFL